jgi:flagellar hook-basal body complex protein FliE
MIDKIVSGLPVQAIKESQGNPAAATPYEVTTSFSSYLKNAINEVNQLQKTADKMNQGLATGQVQDLHQVMIASQKSGIALDMALQIRNKAVEAYQEIMRMQI